MTEHKGMAQACAPGASDIRRKFFSMSMSDTETGFLERWPWHSQANSTNFVGPFQVNYSMYFSEHRTGSSVIIP